MAAYVVTFGNFDAWHPCRQSLRARVPRRYDTHCNASEGRRSRAALLRPSLLRIPTVSREVRRCGSVKEGLDMERQRVQRLATHKNVVQCASMLELPRMRVARSRSATIARPTSSRADIRSFAECGCWRRVGQMTKTTAEKMPQQFHHHLHGGHVRSNRWDTLWTGKTRCQQGAKHRLRALRAS